MRSSSETKHRSEKRMADSESASKTTSSKLGRNKILDTFIKDPPGIAKHFQLCQFSSESSHIKNLL